MGGIIKLFKMKIFYTHKKINSADFAVLALKNYCTEKNMSCPEKVRLTKSKGGKPFANIADIHFSLTHTKGLIAVAVWNREIGIDAERIKELDYLRVLEKYNAKEDINNSTDFLCWWTKKEAQAKLLDIPLTSSLRLSDPLATFVTIKEIADYIITLAYYGTPEDFSIQEL